MRCQLRTTATWRTPFDRLQMRARLHPVLPRLPLALFEVHDWKHMLAAEQAHHADCFFQVVEAKHGPVCIVRVREQGAGLDASTM